MTATPNPPATVVYVGWVREPGRAWRKVCRAVGWDACWDLLLRLVPDAAACEKLVNDGKHPDHRRKPR